MKNKLLLSLSLFLTIFSVFSQKEINNAAVEKTIFGLQTGLFGAWAYNETRLADEVSLRSEVGLNLGIWGGSFYPRTGYILYPTVSVEPRYYYNLKRRVKLGKEIAHNSGNYFSLKTTYGSDLFAVSNYDIVVNNHITVVPKWGLRRSFAKHFEYEFSTGIGYVHDFEVNKGGAFLDIGFRIGFRF